MAALIHGSYLQALNKTTTLRLKNIKFGKFNSFDFFLFFFNGYWFFIILMKILFNKIIFLILTK